VSDTVVQDAFKDALEDSSEELENLTTEEKEEVMKMLSDLEKSVSEDFSQAEQLIKTNATKLIKRAEKQAKRKPRFRDIKKKRKVS